MAYQTAEMTRHLRNRVYDSLLRWVLLVAGICFGAVILWDYGFLGYLFANDTSRISALIIALLAVFSLYCLYALVEFSRELRFTEEVTAAFESGARMEYAAGNLEVAGVDTNASRLVAEYLRDADIKRRNGAGTDLDILMQSLASQLRIPGRRGLFIADVMYKLGMLGTVIGFVAMLVSMRDLGEFDVEAMREALQQMTGGMAVALLTTITGLVSGVLLRLQFNILDALSQHVLRRVVRLSELFVNIEPPQKS